MAKNRIITVQNVSVTVSTEEMDDYICITDMAAAKSDNSRAADVIKNWIRSRSTLEFLGTWKQIYNPNIDLSKKEWGVSPHFAIQNKTSGKLLFGEIKRQDGWVEGKEPSAGRGNAHERLCKLFTPGLLKTYKAISNINEPLFLPFWIVFQGDITRDPKRVREITYWFDSYKGNYFFWRPKMTDADLINFFETWIKRHLL